MSNNYENNKKKRRSKEIWRTIGIIVASTLCAAMLMSVGSFVKPLFEKEVNPDNLIKVDENYIKTQNTNRGVDVEVEEDGTIRLSGEATSDHSLIVAKVALEPGKYTISGLENPDVNEFYMYVHYGVNGCAVAGTDSATFEITEAQTVTVKLSWVDGVKFNWLTEHKIQPVLVEGVSVGSFYAD